MPAYRHALDAVVDPAAVDTPAAEPRPSADSGAQLQMESRRAFVRAASSESSSLPSTNSSHFKLSPAQAQVVARRAMISRFAKIFKV